MTVTRKKCKVFLREKVISKMVIGKLKHSSFIIEWKYSLTYSKSVV